MLSKIIFALLVCVVVITPLPYGTVEAWWKAVFVCSVFGVCILAVIEVAIRGSIRVNPWSPLLPLLALTALAYVQSWTGISADSFQTRFFALQLVALAAFLALSYRYAATEPRMRVLAYAVIGVAVVSAIFGTLRLTAQHETGFLLPLLKPNQGFAQFINKNHFAYLMEMAIGLVIGLSFAERSKQNLLYLSFLAPLWVALVLSNSRGGILAMLTQVVIATMLLLRWAKLRLALAVGLVAGVCAGTLWIGGDRLVSNFVSSGSEPTLSTTNTRENASRNEIWRATTKLFAAHPLLGTGLGGYWIAITSYHDASGVLVPQEAHNDYLELLASGGVIGLAIGVWFAVTVIRPAQKNLWSSTGFVHALRLGAILGLSGVAVHSLFDFGLHLLGNAVVFLTLIVMATTQIETRKVVDPNLQRP
ncbi:MAG TPA: O-antigen ligase family protein [Pyrinomonadaceae bacterium]